MDEYLDAFGDRLAANVTDGESERARLADDVAALKRRLLLALHAYRARLRLLELTNARQQVGSDSSGGGVG